MNQNKKKI